MEHSNPFQNRESRVKEVDTSITLGEGRIIYKKYGGRVPRRDLSLLPLYSYQSPSLSLLRSTQLFLVSGYPFLVFLQYGGTYGRNPSLVTLKPLKRGSLVKGGLDSYVLFPPTSSSRPTPFIRTEFLLETLTVVGPTHINVS